MEKPKTYTITRELLVANAAIARDWRQKYDARLAGEGLLSDLRIEMERAFMSRPMIHGIPIKRRFTG